jgi:hypothetical protein
MIAKSASKSVHSVKCGICHLEIVDRAQIYQAGINLGVICITCYRAFSTEDIEMMANMFIAYGGYYGMIKDRTFSVLKTLENLIENPNAKDKLLDTDLINIKLMHKALLHGISPEHYIKSFKTLLEK